MKTTIIALLCGTLLATQVFGQVETIFTPTIPEQQVIVPHNPLITAIALTIGILGIYVIIKLSCHSSPTQQGDVVTVVLQRSTDNVTWRDVATNKFVYDTNNIPINYWRERIERDPMFYRVRVEP